MEYIHCGSYEQIYFAFYLKNKMCKEITVITYHIGIKKMCEYININVIYYNLAQNISFNIIKQIKYLLKEKIILNELIHSIGKSINPNDHFYLTNKIQHWPTLFITKQLSNYCKVFIADIIFLNLNRVNIRAVFNKKFLRLFYLTLFVKCILKIDIQIFDIGVKFFTGVSDTILLKNNIKIYDYKSTPQKLRTEAIDNQSKLYDKNYDTMILFEAEWFYASSPIGICQKSYLTVCKELFDIVPNFVIKTHPDFINNNNTTYEFLSKNEFFPAFIPSELLFKNTNKNVVAVLSATLISAAKYDKLESISLLELVKWNDNNKKKYYKNWLLKQARNIHFLSDINEIKKYL